MLSLEDPLKFIARRMLNMAHLFLVFLERVGREEGKRRVKLSLRVALSTYQWWSWSWREEGKRRREEGGMG